MANYWTCCLWSETFGAETFSMMTSLATPNLAHAILQQQRLAKSLMACWPFSTCWLSLIKDLHAQICRDSPDAARRMDLPHGRYRCSDWCHLHEFPILVLSIYFLFYIYILCTPYIWSDLCNCHGLLIRQISSTGILRIK